MRARAQVSGMLVAVVACVGACARVASAAPTDDAHRRSADSLTQAEAAVQRGEFATAAAAFEQAAYYEPHPGPLLSAEAAWEKAGEPVRAAEDCDRVLALPTAEERFRSEANKRLALLSPQIASVDFIGPRTMVVRIDASAEVNVPARRRLAPGHHALTIVDLTTSHSRRGEVDLKKGESRIVDVSPGAQLSGPPAPPPLTESPPAQAPAQAPAPAPTPAPAPAPAPHAPASHTPSWIAFGVAGGSSVVAGVFGAITLGNKSDYDAGPTTPTRDAFHRDKAITYVAIAVAGVAAATGVVLWFALPASRESYEAPRAHAGISADGVAFRVRF
jgi:hypothetical protein